MDKHGQMYRVGSWTVKPGKVEEFIKAWQGSANWISENHPGGGEGMLLQDRESSLTFISFATSTMPEKTEKLLTSSESQALMKRIVELCDEVEPRGMQVVGYSTSQPQQ